MFLCNVFSFIQPYLVHIKCFNCLITQQKVKVEEKKEEKEIKEYSADV